MELDENKAIENLIEILREKPWGIDAFAIARSVIYETVGENHPIMVILDDAWKSDNSLDITECNS